MTVEGDRLAGMAFLTREQLKHLICKCEHNHLAHGPQHAVDEYEGDLECRVNGCDCCQFIEEVTQAGSE